MLATVCAIIPVPSLAKRWLCHAHSKASRNLSPVVRLATGPAAGMNGAAPAFTPPLAHGIFRARFPALPRAQVAQLVEQRTENPRVGGSIPSLGTTFLLLCNQAISFWRNVSLASVSAICTLRRRNGAMRAYDLPPSQKEL